MPINKRRKASRQLGSNTHGWGKNQHRGAGTRGGVGNAGRGKKAHSTETKVWGQKYFGKSGFTSYTRSEHTTINLKDIDDRIHTWISEKKATANEVDLGKLGYTKLLCGGKITNKLKIIVPHAAKGAAEKVAAAGGELVVNA